MQESPGDPEIFARLDELVEKITTALADGAPAEHFAREVDRVIADFADYDRPKHLAAARRVANAEQRVALRSLPARAQGRSRRA